MLEDPAIEVAPNPRLEAVVAGAAPRRAAAAKWAATVEEPLRLEVPPKLAPREIPPLPEQAAIRA